MLPAHLLLALGSVSWFRTMIPVLGVLVGGGLLWQSREGDGDAVVRYTTRTGALLVLYASLVMVFERPESIWCWVLALVPALLIGQQMLYLSLVRRPFDKGMAELPDEELVRRLDLDGRKTGSDNARAQRVIAARQAANASDRYFSPSSIWLRLGVPALAIIVITGSEARTFSAHDLGGIFNHAFDGNAVDIIAKMVRGLRYGLAGAYVFVVLNLAVRNFRHDITNGAVVWALSTVAIGPVLAAVVALTWTGLPAVGFTSAAAYFFAGLAPRFVTEAIAAMFRRVFGQTGTAAMAGARLLPLTGLRGVNATIAERLEEDGIDDAYSLGMADPSRLLRSTYFDVRQLVGWMDEALLMTFLPTTWQKLEEHGITGAIDLAWYADDETALNLLARRVGVDEAMLSEVATRLLEDRQVQLLWVLYQTDRSDASYSHGSQSDRGTSHPLENEDGAASNGPTLSVIE
jgi:hypothetical protein